MGAFDRLILDAALVDPSDCETAAAIRAYRARRHPAAGALLVPDRSLAAVGRAAGGQPVEVCVLNTGGAGGLLALAGRAVAGVTVTGVVSPLRDLDDLVGNATRVVSAAAELPDEVTVFVDIPYAVGWVGAVEEVEAAGLSGAVRVGEEDPRRTAERISGLVEADLAFLVTAGVDGALSEGSRTGLLPLMLAVEVLIDGAEVAEAAELLALDDARVRETAGRVAAAVRQWDDPAAGRIRRRLLGVASRTPDRVLEDLAALGLVARA